MKNKKSIIIILFLLFIILSILVKTNLINTFDMTIYNLITLNVNDINTTIYKIFTFLGSTEFVIFLCLFFFIVFIILKKKNIGIIISCVLIISTFLNSILKLIFLRERPDVFKFVEESTYSYPSGHTMTSVSVYGILIYIILKSSMNRKIKIVLSIILGLIPILVGISRVYLGAHYISDVIASFIISIILLSIEINIIDKNKWI